MSKAKLSFDFFFPESNHNITIPELPKQIDQLIQENESPLNPIVNKMMFNKHYRISITIEKLSK